METKVVRESMNSFILGPSQANLLYKFHDICPSFNQSAFPAIMYLFLKLKINKVPVN